MIQNYFFLNRFIVDANRLLTGAVIKEVFSQESSKLVFELEKNDTQYFLEICVIHGQSFINIRDKYKRAKKNTINFFDDAIDNKITNLKIAEDDRIIKIECDYSFFYFAIRGKYTNVFYLGEDDNIQSFKNIDDDILEKIYTELKDKKYSSDFNIPDLTLPSSDYLNKIKKKYPVLGSDIIKEVESRSDKNDD